MQIGNGAHIAGTVELIGDARIGGGNLATIADTGISGKITGNFALDLCAVQTINSFFTLRNPANDWTGTTTFNARNTASANQVNNAILYLNRAVELEEARAAGLLPAGWLADATPRTSNETSDPLG